MSADEGVSERSRYIYSRPFTESDAKQVCAWRYPTPYDVYNLPPWREAVARGWGIARRETREREFHAVTDGIALIGYFRLAEGENAVILGLGLAPDCCGRGLGGQLVELVKEHCLDTYPDKPLRLEVRTFNQRTSGLSLILCKRQ